MSCSWTGFQTQKGNDNAGPVLWNRRRSVFCADVGFHQGLRPAVRTNDMDYIIAGIVTVFLFAYLIYALLRPERF
jgi:K+-transporting ATPase KdpF subunit